jgi:hypothetical protein
LFLCELEGRIEKLLSYTLPAKRWPYKHLRDLAEAPTRIHRCAGVERENSGRFSFICFREESPDRGAAQEFARRLYYLLPRDHQRFWRAEFRHQLKDERSYRIGVLV